MFYSRCAGDMTNNPENRKIFQLFKLVSMRSSSGRKCEYACSTSVQHEQSIRFPANPLSFIREGEANGHWRKRKDFGSARIPKRRVLSLAKLGAGVIR